MNDTPRKPKASAQALRDAVRAAARQEQFLAVVSAEEATARFHAHLDLTPRGYESVPLAQALGRVLAHDIAAPVDAPPFDRSGAAPTRW
jgi:putative molybdopterin biosynthesis protein